MKILLNCINVNASGPMIVVRDVVLKMCTSAPDISFIALLPENLSFTRRQLPANLRVHVVQRCGPRSWWRLRDVYTRIPGFCREFGVDVCFTLGDIGPISLDVPHIVLLHTPYLVYPEPDLRSALPISTRLKLIYLRWHFSRMAKRCAHIIVQTPVMASRVRRLYGIDENRVSVIPAALPNHVRAALKDASELEPRILQVSQPYRLLFLASYYPHKNHKILLPLMNKLSAVEFDSQVHFFLTLDERDRKVKALLNKLAPYSDNITNLGPLQPEQVASALRAADALFLPTLVETFGLIYLEAMACGTQILTSDRDFARWMCRELALYFQPTDPSSIADAIGSFVNSGGIPHYGSNAIDRIREFPNSWDEVAQAYMDILLASGQPPRNI